MFSLRIVKVDHYQGLPVNNLDPLYSTFRGAPVKRVPILRIFGATPAGQKACLHIHGIFPYILVPYDGLESLARLPYTLAAGVDRAINVALGHSSSNTQHVYKITPVSGMPLYGYHSKEHQFLKIYFYNPLIVKKAAELLQNGVIHSKIYQPHESHIPFVLQFLMDHNLHGMNLVHLSKCYFRKTQASVVEGKSSPQDSQAASLASGSVASPIASGKLGRDSDCSICPSKTIWTKESIPEHLWLPENVPRTSTCELEVDGLYSDILNRLQIGGGIATNPGLAYIWEDELERQRAKGGDLLDIKPPDSPPRNNISPSKSEIYYRSLLKDKLQLIHKDKSAVPEEQVHGVSVAAITPEDSTLGPATALDTSALPDVLTQAVGTPADVKREQELAKEALETSRVDEELVLSLTQQSNSQWMDSSDLELLNVMAGLADGSEFVSPEDSDAILSTQRLLGSASLTSGDLAALSQRNTHNDFTSKEIEESDEEETREMTQIIWDSIIPSSEESKQISVSSNETREEEDTQDLEDLIPSDFVLPQLDGTIDEEELLNRSRKPESVNGIQTLVPSGSALIYEKPKAVKTKDAQDCDIVKVAEYSHVSKEIIAIPHERVDISCTQLTSVRTRCKCDKKLIKDSIYTKCETFDDTSDEENFIIPQFDGANDVIVRGSSGSGRKQKTRITNFVSPTNVVQSMYEAPSTHHQAFSNKQISTTTLGSSVMKERKFRGAKSGNSASQCVPYSISSQNVVSSSHHSKLPASSSVNLHGGQRRQLQTTHNYRKDLSYQNTQSNLKRPEYMSSNSSEKLLERAVQGDKIHAVSSSSSSQFPSSSRPMYITPFPGAAVAQRVPGHGDAYIVPALATSKRVNVSGIRGPQMVMQPGLVMLQTGQTQSRQQDSGYAVVPESSTTREVIAGAVRPEPTQTSNVRQQSNTSQLGSKSCRLNQRKHIPPDSMPKSQHESVTPPKALRDRSDGSLESVTRQLSDHSGYSPISDESDNNDSSEKMAKSSKVPEAKNDILKQAFDMTLLGDLDLEDENMEVVDDALSRTEFSVLSPSRAKVAEQQYQTSTFHSPTVSEVSLTSQEVMMKTPMQEELMDTFSSKTISSSKKNEVTHTGWHFQSATSSSVTIMDCEASRKECHKKSQKENAMHSIQKMPKPIGNAGTVPIRREVSAAHAFERDGNTLNQQFSLDHNPYNNCESSEQCVQSVSNEGSSNTYDEFDMMPHTPGSFLPVHEPSFSSRTFQLSHHRMSTDSASSRMQSYGGSDWGNEFDCPPTPGSTALDIQTLPQEIAKFGDDEPSKKSEVKGSSGSSNKNRNSYHEKRGNILSKSDSSKALPSSNEASFENSSATKKKAQKKMALLFGSFSPPSTSKSDSKLSSSLSVSPHLELESSFNFDFDADIHGRPQTPGVCGRDVLPFLTPSHESHKNDDCFLDDILSGLPERPVTPGGGEEVASIFSGDLKKDSFDFKFESVFDPSYMVSSPFERPRTPGGGSSPISGSELPNVDDSFGSPNFKSLGSLSPVEHPTSKESVSKAKKKDENKRKVTETDSSGRVRRGKVNPNQRKPGKYKLDSAKENEILEASHTDHIPPFSSFQEVTGLRGLDVNRSGISAISGPSDTRKSKDANRNSFSKPQLVALEEGIPVQGDKNMNLDKTHRISQLKNASFTGSTPNLSSELDSNRSFYSSTKHCPQQRKTQPHHEEYKSHQVEAKRDSKTDHENKISNLSSAKFQSHSSPNVHSLSSPNRASHTSPHHLQSSPEIISPFATKHALPSAAKLSSHSAQDVENEPISGYKSHTQIHPFKRTSNERVQTQHPQSRWQYPSRGNQSSIKGQKSIPQSHRPQKSPQRHPVQASQRNRPHSNLGSQSKFSSGNKQPTLGDGEQQTLGMNTCKSSPRSQVRSSTDDQVKAAQGSKAPFQQSNRRPPLTHQSSSEFRSLSPRHHHPPTLLPKSSIGHSSKKAFESSPKSHSQPPQGNVTRLSDSGSILRGGNSSTLSMPGLPLKNVGSQVSKQRYHIPEQISVSPPKSRKWPPPPENLPNANASSGNKSDQLGSTRYLSAVPRNSQESRQAQHQKEQSQIQTKDRWLKSIPSLSSSFCKAKSDRELEKDVIKNVSEFNPPKPFGIGNKDKKEHEKSRNSTDEMDTFNLVTDSRPLMSPMPCTPRREDNGSSADVSLPSIEALQQLISPMAPTPLHQLTDDTQLRLHPLSPENSGTITVPITPHSSASFTLPSAPGPLMSPIPPTPAHISSPVHMSPMPVYPSVRGPMISPFAKTPSHSIGENLSMTNSLLSPMPDTPSHGNDCDEKLSLSDNQNPLGNLQDAHAHFSMQPMMSPMPNTPLHAAESLTQHSMTSSNALKPPTNGPAASPIPPTVTCSDDDFPTHPMLSPMPVYPSVEPLLSPMPHTPNHYGVDNDLHSPLPTLPSTKPFMSPLPQTPSYSEQSSLPLKSPLYSVPFSLGPYTPQTPLHTSQSALDNQSFSMTEGQNSSEVSKTVAVNTGNNADLTQAYEHNAQLQETLVGGVQPLPQMPLRDPLTPLTPQETMQSPQQSSYTPIHHQSTPVSIENTILSHTSLTSPLTPLPASPLTTLSPCLNPVDAHITKGFSIGSVQSPQKPLASPSCVLSAATSDNQSSFDNQYSPMPLLPSVPGPVLSPIATTPKHTPQAPSQPLISIMQDVADCVAADNTVQGSLLNRERNSEILIAQKDECDVNKAPSAISGLNKESMDSIFNSPSITPRSTGLSVGQEACVLNKCNNATNTCNSGAAVVSSLLTDRSSYPSAIGEKDISGNSSSPQCLLSEPSNTLPSSIGHCTTTKPSETMTVSVSFPSQINAANDLSNSNKVVFTAASFSMATSTGPTTSSAVSSTPQIFWSAIMSTAAPVTVDASQGKNTFTTLSSSTAIPCISTPAVSVLNTSSSVNILAPKSEIITTVAQAKELYPATTSTSILKATLMSTLSQPGSSQDSSTVNFTEPANPTSVLQAQLNAPSLLIKNKMPQISPVIITNTKSTSPVILSGSVPAVQPDMSLKTFQAVSEPSALQNAHPEVAGISQVILMPQFPQFSGAPLQISIPQVPVAPSYVISAVVTSAGTEPLSVGTLNTIPSTSSAKLLPVSSSPALGYGIAQPTPLTGNNAVPSTLGSQETESDKLDMIQLAVEKTFQQSFLDVDDGTLDKAEKPGSKMLRDFVDELNKPECSLDLEKSCIESSTVTEVDGKSGSNQPEGSELIPGTETQDADPSCVEQSDLQKTNDVLIALEAMCQQEDSESKRQSEEDKKIEGRRESSLTNNTMPEHSGKNTTENFKEKSIGAVSPQEKLEYQCVTKQNVMDSKIENANDIPENVGNSSVQNKSSITREVSNSGHEILEHMCKLQENSNACVESPSDLDKSNLSSQAGKNSLSIASKSDSQACKSITEVLGSEVAGNLSHPFMKPNIAENFPISTSRVEQLTPVAIDAFPTSGKPSHLLSSVVPTLNVSSSPQMSFVSNPSADSAAVSPHIGQVKSSSGASAAGGLDCALVSNTSVATAAVRPQFAHVGDSSITSSVIGSPFANVSTSASTSLPNNLTYSHVSHPMVVSTYGSPILAPVSNASIISTAVSTMYNPVSKSPSVSVVTTVPFVGSAGAQMAIMRSSSAASVTDSSSLRTGALHLSIGELKLPSSKPIDSREDNLRASLSTPKSPALPNQMPRVLSTGLSNANQLHSLITTSVTVPSNTNVLHQSNYQQPLLSQLNSLSSSSLNPHMCPSTYSTPGSSRHLSLQESYRIPYLSNKQTVRTYNESNLFPSSSSLEAHTHAIRAVSPLPSVKNHVPFVTNAVKPSCITNFSSQKENQSSFVNFSGGTSASLPLAFQNEPIVTSPAMNTCSKSSDPSRIVTAVAKSTVLTVTNASLNIITPTPNVSSASAKNFAQTMTPSMRIVTPASVSPGVLPMSNLAAVPRPLYQGRVMNRFIPPNVPNTLLAPVSLPEKTTRVDSTSSKSLLVTPVKEFGNKSPISNESERFTATGVTSNIPVPSSKPPISSVPPSEAVPVHVAASVGEPNQQKHFFKMHLISSTQNVACGESNLEETPKHLYNSQSKLDPPVEYAGPHCGNSGGSSVLPAEAQPKRFEAYPASSVYSNFSSLIPRPGTFDSKELLFLRTGPTVPHTATVTPARQTTPGIQAGTAGPSPIVEPDTRSVDSLGSVGVELQIPFSARHSSSSDQETRPLHTPVGCIRPIMESPTTPVSKSLTDLSSESTPCVTPSKIHDLPQSLGSQGQQTSPLSLVMQRNSNSQKMMPSVSVECIQRKASNDPAAEGLTPLTHRIATSYPYPIPAPVQDLPTRDEYPRPPRKRSVTRPSEDSSDAVIQTYPGVSTAQLPGARIMQTTAVSKCNVVTSGSQPRTQQNISDMKPNVTPFQQYSVGRYPGYPMRPRHPEHPLYKEHAFLNKTNVCSNSVMNTAEVGTHHFQSYGVQHSSRPHFSSKDDSVPAHGPHKEESHFYWAYKMNPEQQQRLAQYARSVPPGYRFPGGMHPQIPRAMQTRPQANPPHPYREEYMSRALYPQSTPDAFKLAHAEFISQHYQQSHPLPDLEKADQREENQRIEQFKESEPKPMEHSPDDSPINVVDDAPNPIFPQPEIDIPPLSEQVTGGADNTNWEGLGKSLQHHIASHKLLWEGRQGEPSPTGKSLPISSLLQGDKSLLDISSHLADSSVSRSTCNTTVVSMPDGPVLPENNVNSDKGGNRLSLGDMSEVSHSVSEHTSNAAVTLTYSNAATGCTTQEDVDPQISQASSLQGNHHDGTRPEEAGKLGKFLKRVNRGSIDHPRAETSTPHAVIGGDEIINSIDDTQSSKEDAVKNDSNLCKEPSFDVNLSEMQLSDLRTIHQDQDAERHYTRGFKKTFSSKFGDSTLPTGNDASTSDVVIRHSDIDLPQDEIRISSSNSESSVSDNEIPPSEGGGNNIKEGSKPGVETSQSDCTVDYPSREIDLQVIRPVNPASDIAIPASDIAVSVSEDDMPVDTASLIVNRVTTVSEKAEMREIEKVEGTPVDESKAVSSDQLDETLSILRSMAGTPKDHSILDIHQDIPQSENKVTKSVDDDLSSEKRVSMEKLKRSETSGHSLFPFLSLKDAFPHIQEDSDVDSCQNIRISQIIGGRRSSASSVASDTTRYSGNSPPPFSVPRSPDSSEDETLLINKDDASLLGSSIQKKNTSQPLISNESCLSVMEDEFNTHNSKDLSDSPRSLSSPLSGKSSPPLTKSDINKVVAYPRSNESEILNDEAVVESSSQIVSPVRDSQVYIHEAAYSSSELPQNQVVAQVSSPDCQQTVDASVSHTEEETVTSIENKDAYFSPNVDDASESNIKQSKLAVKIPTKGALKAFSDFPSGILQEQLHFYDYRNATPDSSSEVTSTTPDNAILPLPLRKGRRGRPPTRVKRVPLKFQHRKPRGGIRLRKLKEIKSLSCREPLELKNSANGNVPVLEKASQEIVAKIDDRESDKIPPVNLLASSSAVMEQSVRLTRSRRAKANISFTQFFDQEDQSLPPKPPPYIVYPADPPVNIDSLLGLSHVKPHLQSLDMHLSPAKKRRGRPKKLSASSHYLAGPVSQVPSGSEISSVPLSLPTSSTGVTKEAVPISTQASHPLQVNASFKRSRGRPPKTTIKTVLKLISGEDKKHSVESRGRKNVPEVPPAENTSGKNIPELSMKSPPPEPRVIGSSGTKLRISLRRISVSGKRSEISPPVKATKKRKESKSSSSVHTLPKDRSIVNSVSTVDNDVGVASFGTVRSPESVPPHFDPHDPLGIDLEDSGNVSRKKNIYEFEDEVSDEETSVAQQYAIQRKKGSMSTIKTARKIVRIAMRTPVRESNFSYLRPSLCTPSHTSGYSTPSHTPMYSPMYTPAHRINYTGPGSTPHHFMQDGLKLRLIKKPRREEKISLDSVTERLEEMRSDVLKASLDKVPEENNNAKVSNNVGSDDRSSLCDILEQTARDESSVGGHAGEASLVPVDSSSLCSEDAPSTNISLEEVSDNGSHMTSSVSELKEVYSSKDCTSRFIDRTKMPAIPTLIIKKSATSGFSSTLESSARFRSTVSMQATKKTDDGFVIPSAPVHVMLRLKRNTGNCQWEQDKTVPDFSKAENTSVLDIDRYQTSASDNALSTKEKISSDTRAAAVETVENRECVRAKTVGTLKIKIKPPSMPNSSKTTGDTPESILDKKIDTKLNLQKGKNLSWKNFEGDEIADKEFVSTSQSVSQCPSLKSNQETSLQPCTTLKMPNSSLLTPPEKDQVLETLLAESARVHSPTSVPSSLSFPSESSTLQPQMENSSSSLDVLSRTQIEIQKPSSKPSIPNTSSPQAKPSSPSLSNTNSIQSSGSREDSVEMELAAILGSPNKNSGRTEGGYGKSLNDDDLEALLCDKGCSSFPIEPPKLQSTKDNTNIKSADVSIAPQVIASEGQNHSENTNAECLGSRPGDVSESTVMSSDLKLVTPPKVILRKLSPVLLSSVKSTSPLMPKALFHTPEKSRRMQKLMVLQKKEVNVENTVYDFEVHSSVLSNEDAAVKVKKRMLSNPPEEKASKKVRRSMRKRQRSDTHSPLLFKLQRVVQERNRNRIGSGSDAFEGNSESSHSAGTSEVDVTNHATKLRSQDILLNRDAAEDDTSSVPTVQTQTSAEESPLNTYDIDVHSDAKKKFEKNTLFADVKMKNNEKSQQTSNENPQRKLKVVVSNLKKTPKSKEFVDSSSDSQDEEPVSITRKVTLKTSLLKKAKSPVVNFKKSNALNDKWQRTDSKGPVAETAHSSVTSKTTETNKEYDRGRNVCSVESNVMSEGDSFSKSKTSTSREQSSVNKGQSNEKLPSGKRESNLKETDKLEEKDQGPPVREMSSVSKSPSFENPPVLDNRENSPIKELQVVLIKSAEIQEKLKASEDKAYTESEIAVDPSDLKATERNRCIIQRSNISCAESNKSDFDELEESLKRLDGTNIEKEPNSVSSSNRSNCQKENILRKFLSHPLSSQISDALSDVKGKASGALKHSKNKSIERKLNGRDGFIAEERLCSSATDASKLEESGKKSPRKVSANASKNNDKEKVSKPEILSSKVVILGENEKGSGKCKDLTRNDNLQTKETFVKASIDVYKRAKAEINKNLPNKACQGESESVGSEVGIDGECDGIISTGKKESGKGLDIGRESKGDQGSSTRDQGKSIRAQDVQHRPIQYSDGISDCDSEYRDSMWNMAFLTPEYRTRDEISPPQAKSPGGKQACVNHHSLQIKHLCPAVLSFRPKRYENSQARELADSDSMEVLLTKEKPLPRSPSTSLSESSERLTHPSSFESVYLREALRTCSQISGRNEEETLLQHQVAMNECSEYDIFHDSSAQEVVDSLADVPMNNSDRKSMRADSYASSSTGSICRIERVFSLSCNEGQKSPLGNCSGNERQMEAGISEAGSSCTDKSAKTMNDGRVNAKVVSEREVTEQVSMETKDNDEQEDDESDVVLMMNSDDSDDSESSKSLSVNSMKDCSQDSIHNDNLVAVDSGRDSCHSPTKADFDVLENDLFGNETDASQEESLDMDDSVGSLEQDLHGNSRSAESEDYSSPCVEKPGIKEHQKKISSLERTKLSEQVNEEHLDENCWVNVQVVTNSSHTFSE
ncbi:hypothetical protein SK128_007274, partial [Halocaridina rubra]